jgi:hypothetical protein
VNNVSGDLNVDFTSITDEALLSKARELLDRMASIFIRIRGYILQVDAKVISPSYTQVRVKYLVRLYDVDRSERVPAYDEVQEYVSSTVDTLFKNKPILASIFDRSDVSSTVSYLFKGLLNDKEKSVFAESALKSARELVNIVIVVSLLKEIYVNNRYELLPILEQYDPQLADMVREYQNVFDSYKMWIPGRIINIWTGNLDVYAVEYPEEKVERYVLGIDYIIDLSTEQYIQERLAECRGNIQCEKELMPAIRDDVQSMIESYKCLNKESEDEFKECMARTWQLEE